MADDGVLGDTFRSNNGSMITNGNTTYTKPQIAEPIRTERSTSSSSSSSSSSRSKAPLKKLKGKKTGASSFFGNNAKSSKSSKGSSKGAKASKTSVVKKNTKPKNNLGFGKTSKAAAIASSEVSVAPKLSKNELKSMMDAFEGDEELDADLDAMPSNTSSKVTAAPELPSSTSAPVRSDSSSSSSSSSSTANTTTANTNKTSTTTSKPSPKIKKYKTVQKIRYEEETVEDDQGYFVTRRKEIKYDEQVTDDEDEQRDSRKRPSPTDDSKSKAKKQKKGGKQRGLMGFFKKK